jgi:ParB family chromosome partitioning protein
MERLDTDLEQPRHTFNEQALEELANSIRQHGILQPLIVLAEEGRYKIIAGERRYRAAQLAGLTDIPARVHNDPATVREVQLVENLQRENLSLIEEAHAFAELRRRMDTSIRGLEEATGKSKSYIARRLKLLDMPEDVQLMLERDPRLMSKAEGIAKIADPKRRAARIKALLHEAKEEPPEVKPRKQGRPARPFVYKHRRDGAFDLIVKYRPDQTDATEILARLKQILEELEAKLTRR